MDVGVEMQEKLRQLQLTQIEILKEIDFVCKANGLKYSLFGGTLLGAVRHKGFIPWDDDLDICMSREDYDKFIDIWEDDDHPGFLIQNKEISPGFTQSFTKIRKNHTTFWQDGEPNNQYHLGIFVDIFPIDRMPNGIIGRKIYQYNYIKYQVYTREYVPIYGNMIEKTLTKFLLFIVSKERRSEKRRKLLMKITRWNNNEKMSLVDASTVTTLKIPLPSDLLDEYIEMEFTGEKYMCFKMWDKYLELTYGDYMKLPPKEERVWKHHPLVLDFEHNYEEL